MTTFNPKPNLLHVWLSNISGVIMTQSKNPPLLNVYDRLKYMGTSNDPGYPKKMSTGRVLHSDYRFRAKKGKRHWKNKKEAAKPPKN